MVNLTRNKNNTKAKKRSILRVLSAPVRYIKRKVKSVHKKLMKKRTKKTDNEVFNEKVLKRKSTDELKEIAKLRRIKNMGKLKRGALITSILKLEITNAERSYMKHFNTNVDNNNTTTNVDTDDDTYDGKIRNKISDIRVILNRLGDIVTKDDRVKIKKERYEIENKKNLSDKEKEKINDNLLELVNKLNKKEKYRYHDRDDLDYHGIRDIENLFDADNNEDYYKPILVKSSFNESHIMKAEVIKTKNYQ